MVKELVVRLNGVPAGRLIKDCHGILSFVYEPAWLAHPLRRPLSLSLPLSPRPLSSHRVFHFFQNLLPDSEPVLALLAACFKVPNAHPFDLLSAIGRDCAGALELLPADAPASASAALAGDRLTDHDVAQLLGHLSERPLGLNPNADFRLTLAGAQSKTALLRHGDCWLRPTGATPTSHLLKPPIGRLPGMNPIDLRLSCENEWLCLLITRLFGFATAEAEIQRFGDAQALVVRRFDRRWSDDGRLLFRLPTEDLCQALGVSPLIKYEADGGPGIADIMALLQLSETPDADRETFFRSQALFWLLQATDGHAKNYSVFLLPDGGFRLTPLYDILSTAPLTASGALSERRVKMAMGLLGKNKHYRFHDIEPRHFLTTARAMNFPENQARRALTDLAQKTPGVIEAARAALPPDFPEEVAEPILTGLASRSQCLQAFLTA